MDKILDIIKNKGDRWREEISRVYPEIQITDNNDRLVLFKTRENYFSNRSIGLLDAVIDKEKLKQLEIANGMIIDLDLVKIVCRPTPFIRKRFNKYNIEDAKNMLDWSCVRVQYKPDGIPVSLWYNRKKGQWSWSTDSSIYASYDFRTISNISVQDILRKMVYNRFNFDSLNTDFTYNFILVSPDIKVIIQYYEIKLYHVSTINNFTGEEIIDKMGGVDCLNEFLLLKFQDIVNLTKNLSNIDKNNNGKVVGCTIAGYTLIDCYGNKAILSNNIYDMLNVSSSTHEYRTIKRSEILKPIMDKEIDVDKLSKSFPQVGHILKYYDYAIDELFYEAKLTISVARRLNLVHSPSEVMDIMIKDNFKLLGLIQLCLGNDKDINELINESRYNTITLLLMFIKPYQSTNIGNIYDLL